MNIRPETPAEFAALYGFTQTVFSTAKVSDGNEQNFVDKLRAGKTYLPELSLVAEEDGTIIGHIMLSEIVLTDEETGKNTVILMLAPLSVALEQRGKGVGAKLVAEAFKRAQEKGYPACILIGDPAYYGRFGFQCSAEHGVRAKQDIPAQYVQICELIPGALKNLRGTVDFPE